MLVVVLLLGEYAENADKVPVAATPARTLMGARLVLSPNRLVGLPALLDKLDEP